jgi:hypothetical protein
MKFTSSIIRHFEIGLKDKRVKLTALKGGACGEQAGQNLFSLAKRTS